MQNIRKLAIKQKKPWLHVNPSTLTKKDAVEELADSKSTNHSPKVINVAGRNASKDKMIYDSVYQVIGN
jgi:hypothetical protein